MTVKVEDISSSMLDGTSNLEERDRPVRINYTDSQRQRLEKAFCSCKYPGINDKEHLASSIGIKVKQVENWFRNRRAKCHQRLQRRRLINRVRRYRRYTMVTLKKELYFERKKTAELSKQLNNISSQYDNVVCQKDEIIQKLKKARLMISQLNNRIWRSTRRLTRMIDLKNKTTRKLEKTTSKNHSAEWQIEIVNPYKGLKNKIYQKLFVDSTYFL